MVDIFVPRVVGSAFYPLGSAIMASALLHSCTLRREGHFVHLTVYSFEDFLHIAWAAYSFISRGSYPLIMGGRFVFYAGCERQPCFIEYDAKNGGLRYGRCCMG